MKNLALVLCVLCSAPAWALTSLPQVLDCMNSPSQPRLTISLGDLNLSQTKAQSGDYADQGYSNMDQCAATVDSHATEMNIRGEPYALISETIEVANYNCEDLSTKNITSLKLVYQDRFVPNFTLTFHIEEGGVWFETDTGLKYACQGRP